MRAPLAPQLGRRQTRRHAEADDAGDVLRAGAPLPLLVAAPTRRLNGAPAAQEDRAHPLRPVDLVRRDRQRVDPQRGDVDGIFAGRLHGVRVKQRAACARAMPASAATS